MGFERRVDRCGIRRLFFLVGWGLPHAAPVGAAMGPSAWGKPHPTGNFRCLHGARRGMRGCIVNFALATVRGAFANSSERTTCGKMAGEIGDIHDKYPSRENGDFPFALGEFFLRWRSFSHDARRASFLDLSRWVDGRARPDIHLRPGARRWRPIARGIALCKGPVRRLSLGSTRRPRNRRQVVSRPFGPITQSPNRRGPAGSSTSSVVLCPPS